MKKLKSLHYAWYVAIGCCLLFFYGVGLTTGTFAIFLPPLTNELNLTNIESSSIFSVISIIGLFFMITVRKISAKIGIRMTVLLAGIMIALGNLVFSISKSLLHCYFAAILIGVGYGCCSTITIAILLNRWFLKSKGTAIGMAFSGSGIAIIIFSPVLTSLIINLGVRTAFIIQCIIILIFSALSYLLIRDYPKDISAEPYGNSSNITYTKKDTLGGTNSKFDKDILLSKKFITMIVIALLLGTSVQPMVSHLPSFLISVGYDESIAMSIVSLYGLSMVIWKSSYGFIIDKLGSHKTNLIFFPLWILILIFSFMVDKSIILAYIYLLIIGVGPAIATVSIPIWVAIIFEDGPIDLITTTIQVTTIFGSSVGMVLFGYFLDLTGIYNIPLLIIIFFSSITFICITTLYKIHVKSIG